jgi:tape measure domain-containing protein
VADVNNPITSQDFFDDQGHLDSLLKKLQANHTEIQEIVKTAAKLEEALKGLNITKPGDRQKIAELATEIDRLKRSEEALRQAMTDTEGQIQKNKLETQKLTREQKLNAQLANSLEGSYDRLSAQYSLNKIRLNSMTDEYRKNTAEGKKLEKETKAIYLEMIRLQEATGKHQLKVGRYTDGISGLTASLRNLLLTYISISGAQQLVATIFGQTKALDGLDKAIKLTTGSEIAAADAKKYLSDLTERLGINLLSTTRSYLKYSIAAKSAGLDQSQVNGIFEKFAKIGSSLGLAPDELDGIFKALEQILSKGTVQAEELRGQLGDRLPGAFTIMAKALGVTTSKLNDMLKKGQVLANDALPKFAAEAEKAFGVTNVERVDNLAAAQARFNRAITLIIEKLDASGTFKAFFNTLTDIFTVIGNNLDLVLSLGKGVLYMVGAWITWGVTLRATTFLQKAGIITTGAQTAQVAGLTLATRIATAAQVAFNNAVKANPFGIIATVAITAIGLLQTFKRKTDDVVDSMSDIDKAVQQNTESTKRQKAEFNFLIDVVKKVGISETTRKDALDRLNTIYKDYLPNLLTEKSSLDEINIALAHGNRLLDEQITFKAFQASIKGQEDKIIQNRTKLNDLELEGIRIEERKNQLLGIQKTPDGKPFQVTDTANPTSGKAIDDVNGKLQENTRLSEENRKAQEALTKEYDQMLELAAKSGVDVKKLLESLRGVGTGSAGGGGKTESELEKEFKKQIELRKKQNEFILDDRERELGALQINLDEQLHLFEKNGLETTGLIQHFRNLRTEIENKYIDIEDKKRDDVHKKELDRINKEFAEEQRLNEANFNKTKHTDEEVTQFKLLQEIQQISHLIKLREKGLIYLSDEEIKIIKAQIIEKLRLFEKAEQEGQLKALEVRQEGELAKFNTSKHTELEINRFRLEQEIKYWQEVLRITKDLSPERAQIIKDTISGLQNELDLLPNREVTDIFSLLGITFKTDESKQLVVDAFAFAKEQLQSYFDLKAELIQQDVEASNERVARAEAALAAEIQAERDGHASRVETARKDLALAKKEQQETIKQQIAFQKAQLAVNTALEASNLIVAVTKILSDPKLPFPLDLAAVGVMLGGFTAAKIKAFQLAGKQKFGEGGLEIIGGGTHASGNDTDLGFTTKSGKRAFGEVNEAHAIINARNTKKYRHALPDIVNSLNRGTFFEIFARRDDPQSPVNIIDVNTSRMEGSLDTLVKQGKKHEYTDKDGRRVVVQGHNRTTYLN